MKQFYALGIAVLLFAYSATIVRPLQTATKADQPFPRSDQNSMIAHQQLLEKAKQGKIDIYFEGDSITRRWGTSDEQYKHFLENWRANFTLT